MEKDYLFFISHRSEDREYALELESILLEANPEWKGKIFLDCGEAKPLEVTPEWEQAMMEAASNSRHLIFIARKVDHLKKGNGWLRKEVAEFHKLHENHMDKGRPDKNISYFGIFLCDCNLEKDLFADPEYGRLYSSMLSEQEHLLLGGDTTLAKEKVRIQEKAKAMVERRPYDDFACIMRERVREFRDNQIKNGAMWADSLQKGETADPDVNYIDDRLLPPLVRLPEDVEDLRKIKKEDLGKYQLPFEELCKLVQQQHVMLIGKEGGSGKTTLMTKLFHHQLKLCEEDLEKNMIPLYVDAKALGANDSLIIRYLAKVLLQDVILLSSKETGDKANQIAGAFAEERNTPRYLLLIDGYNELPKAHIKQLENELWDLIPEGPGGNVRVVISGREIGGDLPEEDFVRVQINQLDLQVVEQYVNKNITQSALEILRTPMYLKIFQDTGVFADVQTKTDLLKYYLIRQEQKGRLNQVKQQESKSDPQQQNARNRRQERKREKEVGDEAGKRQAALHRQLLRHMMPMFAYNMMANCDGKSAFFMTEEQLDDVERESRRNLLDDTYQKYYNKENRQFYEDLEKIDLYRVSSLDRMKAFEDYFVRISKLLHKNSDNNYEFVHQIYRDFFCAWYIAESIRYDLHRGECSDVLSKVVLSGDVTEFVKDLLGETDLKYDPTVDGLDFSCNDHSCLVKTLDLIRLKKPEDEAKIVANVVELLRYARWKKLAGLNLSALDLTESNLQGCVFSQFDKHGTYATNFAEAKINKDNFFAERHYDNLRCVCTDKKHLACLDEGGFLKLWEKKMFPRFPLQVLTDLNCAARKLMFNTAGDKIYAMTLHEILEIPIPAKHVFVSRAMPKRIFRTPHQLSDMMLDAQGELLFSTYLNPFNFKKISDPDTPDRIPVYCMSSAAAVNRDGTCLAYGFIAGHNELKLYDLQKDGTWQERLFGYGKLLQEFMLDLEELIKAYGMYDLFDKQDKPQNGRKIYFIRKQRDFMDRNMRFDKVLDKVSEKIRKDLNKQLEKRKTDMPEQMRSRWDALVEEHRQRIKTALDEQGTIMHMNGRQITGLSFHSDNKTLLISGTVDYRRIKEIKDVKKSTACDNWVVTLDTQTMEARKINLHRGENANRAFYCGDDIVVMTRYQVNVYDHDGREVAIVKPEIHRLKKMLHVPDQENFYILSNHNIYEMNQSLGCVRAMRNSLNEMEVCYILGEDGAPYLCRQQKKTREPDLTGGVLCLSTGNKIYYKGSYTKIAHTENNLTIGPRHFEYRCNQLVGFCEGEEYAETSIYQGLYVCGCNFTGVTGSITEQGYLQMLYRMGAVTDPVILPQVQITTEEVAFIPEKANLQIPRKHAKIPYVYYNQSGLYDKCSFKGGDTDSYLANKKTWEILQSEVTEKRKMNAADFSALEWVDQLRFATWEVINDLAAAGLIPYFSKDEKLASRVWDKLHSNSKFFFCAGHPNKDGIVMSAAIATIHEPFGTTLLSYATGNCAQDPWYELRKKKGEKIDDSLELTEEMPESDDDLESEEFLAPEELPEEIPQEDEIPQEQSAAVEEKEAHDKPRKFPSSICIDTPEMLMKVRVILALNRWFSLTAKQYKDKIEDYALNKVFETKCHYDGRGNVNGYLRLGDQAFFGQAIHGFDADHVSEDDEVINKVTRLCTLARYYRTLACRGLQLDGMNRQPIVVLIGQSFPQCKQLNEKVRNICPQVRKIYTYDSLLPAEEAGQYRYFEFVGNTAKRVNLDDLIQ